MNHVDYKSTFSLLVNSDGKLFHPRIFLLVCILSCILIGIFSRWGWILAGTQIVLWWVTYLRTKRVADLLSVIRVAPPEACEFEKITVRTELCNPTPFQVYRLLVEDRFGGASQQGQRRILARLDRRSRNPLLWTWRCDGGMGEHAYGPIIVWLSDAFGLFEFKIEISNIEMVTKDQSTRVYPRILALPDCNTPPTEHSLRYGPAESRLRTESVNYVGPREYQRGDALKHISWRLSAKHQRLLVKEFEQLTDSLVTVVANLDGRDHVGTPGACTWEMVKDLAISYCDQQVRQGNQARWLSQDKGSDFLRTPAQIARLIREVYHLEPRVGRRHPLEGLAQTIPIGSSLIYVSPYLRGRFAQQKQWLSQFRHRRVSVFCVFIDPVPYLGRHFIGGNLGIEENDPRSDMRELQKNAVQVRFLSGRGDYKQELLREFDSAV